MCGIAGFKCFGTARPTKDEIIDLLTWMDHRGGDATGIAWLSDECRLKIIKANIDAWKFVESEPFKAIQSIPNQMIMHTRKATQGTFNENENNHPIFTKTGLALVHNGMIYNDNVLFSEMGLKRDGEVDSEIILKLLERGWWDDIKYLNAVNGSMAIAMLNKNKPNELILARADEPIAVYIDTNRDILFFTSTEDSLISTFSSFHRGFRTNTIHAYELEDNEAYLLNQNGIEDTRPLSVRKYYSEWYMDVSDGAWKKKGEAANRISQLWDEKYGPNANQDAFRDATEGGNA